MVLIVFFRGINVGGHRTFRPSVLARELGAFDVVNVGAAGTLVVRKPGSRSKFIAELRRKLPFKAEIAFCNGKDLIRLQMENPFGVEPSRPDAVRFVSVLSKPVATRLPFRSQFRKVESGSYESSGRKIDWCLECIGAT